MYISRLLKRIRGWGNILTAAIIIAIIIIGIGVYYYLETTYRQVTEEGVYKVKVTPHTGGNIEVKDDTIIAKPVRLGEGYSNSFRLKLSPVFNSKNTTIILYVKILENPTGEDYDGVIIWPRGVISAGETPKWHPFGFDLKVGVTYKITLKYPDKAYCEPEPLSPIRVHEIEAGYLSPQLVYLQFSCSSTIMIWNITVIIGKS